ncbi:MAG: DNA polymerase III subunit gamma/tau [Acidobacteria bacterium]|nr:MAG: DNA polymerase III subunit gamma/tau [Acidobacteriota bacterium]
MSYQVIARKYRPQFFDDVAGQRLITDTLKNAVIKQRVAHGYIFSGARGVGKTTTARILAKSLNCIKGPTVTPCGECPSCQEIAQGNSVDVFEIDAASNRGIDEIRELRETVRYLPARDLYKVFIIDEAHMLTTEAFNALLKTLEEPPPRSLFVLCTTEAHKLPTTIQSRCQHFSFRLLDYSEILSRIEWVMKQERLDADEGALSAVAEAAEGSLRDALSLLDQAIASSAERLEDAHVRQLLGVVSSQVLTDLVESIAAGDTGKVLQIVERVAAEGYELNHFCGELTRYIRNLAVAKSCGTESPLLQLPSTDRAVLGKLREQFSEEDLARFFQILVRTENDMRYALNPRFQMELGLIKMVHAGKLRSLESLLAELEGSSQASIKKAAPDSSGNLPTSASVNAGKSPYNPRLASQAPVSIRQTEAPRNPEKSLKHPATAPMKPVSSMPTQMPPGISPVQPAPSEAPGDPRLTRIKSLAFGQSKLLSSCLDPVSGWRFENGEVCFIFSKSDSWAADLLSSREQQEKLQTLCAEVLGQPVRICVTLDNEEKSRLKDRRSVRERAESDGGVEALVKKFRCTLVDVIDLSLE